MNLGKIKYTNLSVVVDETAKNSYEKSSHCKIIEISHSNTYQKINYQIIMYLENGVYDSTI